MKTPSGRLLLDRPTADDAQELFQLVNDPRVWTHFPSLRPTDISETIASLARWDASWQRDGVGVWIVRLAETRELVGYAGCDVRGGDLFWNLGYRFGADHHGHGYATEASLVAMEQARRARPELPIVAFLLEHNQASAVVAEKVGLTLRHRAPDAGNPDPDAVRLVYSDRELSNEELTAALQ